MASSGGPAGDALGAYPGGHRDPDPGDRQYVNNTPDAWRHYDWSLVTTVDTFTNHGTVDPELLCTAHEHGARVVIGAAAQNSKLWTGPEVRAPLPCRCGPCLPERMVAIMQGLNSSAHRTALSADIVANVVAQGADGANIDIEWPPTQLRDDLTTFTCELSALLRRTVPGAEITFDMPSRPLLYEPGTLAYDFDALIECVDYFMVMDCKMRRCFLVDFISLSVSLSGQASRSLR